MTYLLNYDNNCKPIVFSTNEQFFYDCQEALTKAGYRLLLSENPQHKKVLLYEINQHGTETVLGSANMPSVAKIIVDFFEVTYHAHLEYEYVGWHLLRNYQIFKKHDLWYKNHSERKHLHSQL